MILRISTCGHVESMYSTSRDVPQFKGTLRNVLWDGRVMAITVEEFDVVEVLHLLEKVTSSL